MFNKLISANDSNGINNVNPLLVNAATGDPHLKAGSPVINAGQSIPEASRMDIDGKNRAQGAFIECGRSALTC